MTTTNRHDNNKRIAKNTAFLYVRMLFSMLVSLYTSRVVLNALGVDDYGIYNVVGGVIVMLGFMNGAMATGTQRFLNFEMGCGNLDRLKKVFSTSLSIHISIAFFVLILAETIGLWFVNTQLVIPAHRLVAANWVYQFSILSAMVSLTQVPYTASIIANEKMDIYGYVGIAEVLLRLVIVYLLVVIPFDKLELYGILTFAISIVIAMAYRIYCKKKFAECSFELTKDRDLYKEMLSFSGWNLFGSMAGIAMNQGQNIILNIFFGPAVNAARAVAVNVNSAITQFVTGFTTASNPQIVKNYAAKDFDVFFSLLLRTSKFAFFLMFILAMPILLKPEYVLALWLKNPPEYASLFCTLTIIDTLIGSVSIPLMTAAQATGTIKRYQAVVGTILLLNLPLSYVALKLGLQPISVYMVNIFISLLAFVVRINMLKTLIKLPIRDFLSKVCGRCWMVFVLTIIPLYIISIHTPDTFLNFVWFALLSVSFSTLMVYLLGTTRSERAFINENIINIAKKYVSKNN